MTGDEGSSLTPRDTREAGKDVSRRELHEGVELECDVGSMRALSDCPLSQTPVSHIQEKEDRGRLHHSEDSGGAVGIVQKVQAGRRLGTESPNPWLVNDDTLRDLAMERNAFRSFPELLSSSAWAPRNR